MKRFGAGIWVGGALLMLASPSDAGPPIVGRYKTEVEGRKYRVLVYKDDTVKVALGGVFGPGVSIQLRDKMRRAVEATTHCAIVDDFWLDGKLSGKLSCAQ
ncbi:hypothetical protein LK533_14135 [Sphingomonas sp. PL-96]|uniref:hypothetical protein n=1 Tax=Sphingomonas sp. PL-96 TaxID=2887201 RepID=UPI001E555BD2|nr:hypothetical protein [Sphingomonas sp. PL-96]MCC2977811.1 hypothetical protein [Sphingomonas sp. PL-96]